MSAIYGRAKTTKCFLGGLPGRHLGLASPITLMMHNGESEHKQSLYEDEAEAGAEALRSV